VLQIDYGCHREKINSILLGRGRTGEPKRKEALE
jgi:hypothetical protein